MYLIIVGQVGRWVFANYSFYTTYQKPDLNESVTDKSSKYKTNKTNNTMTIESKYNVGEVVYIKLNGMYAKVRVKAISFYTNGSMLNMQYEFLVNDRTFYLPESQVFETC